jgi:hypothetical protein
MPGYKTWGLIAALASGSAFAEAGLPYFEVCTSPPCTCGTQSCSCGQVCSLGQCQQAQAAYCSLDVQCGGSGTCGTFVCDLNVCVATDGGMRPDGGGDPAPQPARGCATAPTGALLTLALALLRRREGTHASS